LTVDKSDVDEKARALLARFRKKVSQSRLVKFWTSADQLPGLVATSLPKTIKTYPAMGWVRGDQVASKDLLITLDTLRKEKEALQHRLMQLENRPLADNLAGWDEPVPLHGTYMMAGRKSDWWLHPTWRAFFAWLSPHCTLPERSASCGAAHEALDEPPDFRGQGRQ
jgi:hypothetical protein